MTDSPHEILIVSFAEDCSGHSVDIKTLASMLSSVQFSVQRFVLEGDLSNIETIPAVPIVLVMNAAMAVNVSHKRKRLHPTLPIISYCAWELPNAPDGFGDAPIDLVVAGSNFAYESFVAVCGARAVYLPLIVDQAPDDVRNGSAHGGAFTFLSVFSLCSYAARKNPAGIISAFREAFSPSDNGVALVLKVSGGHCDPDELYRLRTAAEQDRRVQVIEQRLSDKDMKKLYARCDAYVSLHRSEGFGRTIAEAMAHGKLVIATGWSGSEDLMGCDAGFRCDFNLRQLKGGEYVEYEGQYWAEPDVAHAAKLMRRAVALSRADRMGYGMRAKRWVQQRFSYDACRLQYASMFLAAIDADTKAYL